MQSKPIFVGRTEELDELIRWIEHEPASQNSGRTGILVGPAGMGKSVIIEALERRCIERMGINEDEGKWYVHLYTPLNLGKVDTLFERLLQDTHKVVKELPTRTGPNYRELLSALLKLIPKVGNLIDKLIGQQTRKPWERYLEYLQAASAVLKKRNARFVLLIDPKYEMKEGSADEWLAIASDVPACVRVLIAQRPSDVMAVDPRSIQQFCVFPQQDRHDRQIEKLPEKDVEDWLNAEMLSGGRLTKLAEKWSTDTKRDFAQRVNARYDGHPFSINVVVELLRTEKTTDPLPLIERWPPEVEGLLEELFKSLAPNTKRIRAGLMLQVFGVPTPREAWREAVGLSGEGMSAMLSDPKFNHFFPSIKRGEVDTDAKSERYAPFHALWAERLEKELEKDDAYCKELAEAAWKVIKPLVAKERLGKERPDEFELEAAIAVARRFGDPARLHEALNLTFWAKLRVGLLASAESDLLDAIERNTERDETVNAACYGNLGVVYHIRGDLDRAEEMHRKSLEIDERLGRLEGMASDYGNLGNVYYTRGDLDRAEEMYRKTLEIDKRLGRLESITKVYGNLGNVYYTRGDLNRAEEMYRKALEIDERLGRLEGMANDYDGLGNVYCTRGDLDRAEEMHRKSLEIEERLGRLEGMASQYGSLGNVYYTRSDLDRAEEMYRKALEIDKRLGKLEGMASDYGNLGNVYYTRGDLDRAEEMYRKSLEINERLGRLEGMANQYGNLGIVYRTRGDLDRAEEMYRKALEIDEQLGRLGGMASDYGGLGNVYRTRGDLNRAKEMHRKSLEINERIGRLEGMASDYGSLGLLEQARGHPDAARDHWEESMALYQKLGASHMVERVKGWLDELDNT